FIIGRRIHHAQELDDPFYFFEVSKLFPDRTEDCKTALSRSELSFVFTEIFPKFARYCATICIYRNMTRHIHVMTIDNTTSVNPFRSWQDGQFITELF